MKKMLMMCALCAEFAMGLGLTAFAAAGDCEEHATSISVGETKAVKLVNEWDFEWQETTGNPVHILKIVCKNGKGYTVTVSGNSDVSFYVDVPWSYDDDAPWFDYDKAGTSATLYESSWEEGDYPESINYYVYVSGERIGDSVNVSFEGDEPDGGPYTETVDGITWTFMVANGKASVGDGSYSAISQSVQGAITIPSVLGKRTVTSIGERAFFCCRGLTSVTIPESVTSIAYRAFSDCSALKSVTIPSSVKSICDSAFGGCSSLSAATIEWGVESIGCSAFAGCKALKSVSVPSSVKEIGSGAFSGCSSLGTVTLPSGIAVIGASTFSGCSSLKTIALPSGVTTIGDYAFSQCTGLQELTIPRNTQRVNGLSFCGCTALQRIKVEAGNASFCAADGVLFDAGKTTLVAFPGGKKGAYSVPAGVARIGTAAFDQCAAVTSVEFPDSVSEIGAYAFSYCSSLKSFKVDAGNPHFQSYDGVVFSVDYSELVVFPCGRGGDYSVPKSVRRIGDSAFNGCASLTSVTVPESVAEIGLCAFNACEKLAFVSLAEGLERVGEHAFSKCKTLASVALPAGLLEIGPCAFVYCHGLTRVTIPSSVTDIGWNAFSGCTSLKKIYVEEGCEEGVREMLDASGFYWTQTDFDPTRVEFVVIGDVPTFGVVAGMKVDIDVGLVGYKATGLPKGLTLNAKGHVTGTTKSEGEYEVTFTKKGEEDETAVFVVRKESAPTLECEALEAGSFTVGVAGAAGGMPIAISAESGVKSVTQKNLPTGMKLEQDKTTKQWRVTGAPTKAGPCKVKLTVTTVAGNKVEKEFEIAVATLPDMVVGTFNGFVSQRKQYDAEFGKPFGAIQVTTTDGGKITAKITAAAKTYSFSATCWDEVKDGVYSVNVTLKTGEALSLMLDSSAGWDGYQLTGRFSFAGTPSDGSYYELSAQRNAFGKTWYFDVEGSEADGWRFSYAGNPKTSALTLSLNADGKTSIAGKLGDLRVSASGYSDVSEMRNGCVIADFAPVVTVMDNKKSVKMLLAIRTNLWFDRSNDHELIGSAELVR